MEGPAFWRRCKFVRTQTGHDENRVGDGAGSDLCPRKGLWAWAGGMPLVNCVTLNSKSALWFPSSLCTVPGWQ